MSDDNPRRAVLAAMLVFAAASGVAMADQPPAALGHGLPALLADARSKTCVVPQSTQRNAASTRLISHWRR